MSSSAPTIVISAAAARIPSVRWLSGRKKSPATSAPPKIARPPRSGVCFLARPMSLSSSTAPMRRAKRAATGVRAAATANATSAARTALVTMVGGEGSQGAPTLRRNSSLTSRETGLSTGMNGEESSGQPPLMSPPLAHAFLALADDDAHVDQRSRPRIFAAALAAVVLALGAPLGYLSLHPSDH